MRSAYQWGIDHGSCLEALKARRALGKQATQADWWRVHCPRGDWMIWQLRQLHTDRLRHVLPSLLRALERIVQRAVEPLCEQYDLPELCDWAQGWMGGVDRSEAAAIAAAESAVTGSEADAAAAAARLASMRKERASKTRASTAQLVLAAAAGAATASWSSMEELRRQADDIRAEIPEWPGEL
jgi:hypothetical protein